MINFQQLFNISKSQSNKLTVSSDLKRYARISGQNDSDYVILDGVPQPQYKAIYDLVFSQNSKHFSYRARKADDSIVVVIDGVESISYNAAQKPVFCEDINAYVGFYDEGPNTNLNLRDSVYVIGGKEMERYDRIYDGKFSNDCKNFKYVAKQGNDFFLVEHMLSNL